MLKTKKVIVGSQVFKLLKDSDMYRDRNLLGLCHKDHSLIKYSDQHPESVVADTVLHEVLHAIWHNYLSEDSAEEEKAVTMLTHGLIQVIRDNPKFIDEIRGML